MRRPGSLLLAVSVVLLVTGILVEPARQPAWALAGGLGAVAALVAVVRGLRQGRGGVDILALLAIAGALAIGEFFAAAILTVMIGTGQFLEERAQARAERELNLLAKRAPRFARRVRDDQVTEIDVDQVAIGDLLMLAAGDIVAVDGRLAQAGTFDESVLTGEALPVQHVPGDMIRSGTVNAGHPTTMLATAVAAESTYAGVIRLVTAAQASAAPFVRLADRLAFWFVPLSLAIAAAAWWFNGTPTAAVAVLVVATPCPLLLAVPIAIIGGVSQCAKRGVVVKGGASLERLAGGEVLLFDKTGTLTAGRPEVVHTAMAPGVDETDVLRISASLDQMSPHVLATAVVNAARTRHLDLSMPSDVQEIHGQGVQGTVDGARVRIGRPAWVLGDDEPAWAQRARRRADLDGSLIAFVGIEDRPVAALLFADRIRADAPGMVRALRADGMQRIVLVSGDRADLAESIGRIVGVDAVWADQTPADKVAVVQEEAARGATIMVGDGINDAPALAAASVGVALAARGATASSEAADVVLTVDRIERLGQAVRVARSAHATATQAAWIGMSLCFLAMGAAALGALPPAAGAVLQEGIDLVAILWALRVGLIRPRGIRRIPPADADVLSRLADDHRETLALVEKVRDVADELEDHGSLLPTFNLLTEIDQVLLPHERQEEAELVPALVRITGSSEAVGALSRSHAEIEHHVAMLRRSLAEPDEHTVTDVRRTLYSLYGVLRLHNALEEESAFSLIE
ncbi:MAG: heavy metal translocating P-type ATPase [Candidatus Nanopelagicales bacterium]|nr:heavy metal translocating P-type ATPase [Candidatus Nanopelagicales bacterium]